jgi:hypothetical protein
MQIRSQLTLTIPWGTQLHSFPTVWTFNILGGICICLQFTHTHHQHNFLSPQVPNCLCVLQLNPFSGSRVFLAVSYGLNVFPKFMCWCLITNVIVLRGGPLRKDEVVRDYQPLQRLEELVTIPFCTSIMLGQLLSHSWGMSPHQTPNLLLSYLGLPSLQNHK